MAKQPRNNAVTAVYLILKKDGKKPEKCDELKWVAPDDLPANMTPHVRHAVECAERGEIFSELGLDFLKLSGLYDLYK